MSGQTSIDRRRSLRELHPVLLRALGRNWPRRHDARLRRLVRRDLALLRESRSAVRVAAGVL